MDARVRSRGAARLAMGSGRTAKCMEWAMTNPHARSLDARSSLNDPSRPIFDKDATDDERDVTHDGRGPALAGQATYLGRKLCAHERRAAGRVGDRLIDAGGHMRDEPFEDNDEGRERGDELSTTESAVLGRGRSNLELRSLLRCPSSDMLAE